jgi:glutamate N-acetyltransferase/amino-acid N-acetyltransferase
MAETTSELLDIPKEYVQVASTGLIGEPFPTENVLNGIHECVEKLSGREMAGSLTANAILTTDTYAKEGFDSFEIDGIDINMAGIAKGSGMIHPNMGTMLGFICCDISITSDLLDEALRTAVNKTFNMITVDGDTSTNDTVVILCNGKAGNEEITEKDSHYEKFLANLEHLCKHLAKLIISDGEGSTKLIEYRVVNAKTDIRARKIARTVSNSNLVKTAIYGSDPNWGRILAAAGRAGVDFDPQKVDLYIGSNPNKMLQILESGQPINKERSKLKSEMKESTITIKLNMNNGSSDAIAWGSDFSYEYVRINAEYTT